MTIITETVTTCADCPSEDAPHLGELVTTQVGDGIVRCTRARRCTPCQQKVRIAASTRETS